MLDSIQSSALRLAVGALRTSLTLSLCAEAGVPPLQFRFPSLNANFLASTAQFPQIPIVLPSFCLHNSLRPSLESQPGKHLRLKPLPHIHSSSPPWTLALPDIRLDLAALPRCPNSTYQKRTKAIIVNKFSTHPLRCTDGSKLGSRIGYVFSINDIITHHRLRNSVSSAELFAIYSCFSHPSLFPSPFRFPLLFLSHAGPPIT